MNDAPLSSAGCRPPPPPFDPAAPCVFRRPAAAERKQQRGAYQKRSSLVEALNNGPPTELSVICNRPPPRPPLRRPPSLPDSADSRRSSSTSTESADSGIQCVDAAAAPIFAKLNRSASVSTKARGSSVLRLLLRQQQHRSSSTSLVAANTALKRSQTMLAAPSPQRTARPPPIQVHPRMVHAEPSHVVVERIYCVQQVIQKVSEDCGAVPMSSSSSPFGRGRRPSAPPAGRDVALHQSLTRQSFRTTNNDENSVMAEALWDHVTMQADELGFAAGDVISVCDWSSTSAWFGVSKDRSGWFPPSHVRLLTNQSDKPSTGVYGETARLSGGSAGDGLSRIRAKVVEELLTTERDYCALLGNLVEARRRTELFPPQMIKAIFGNLEELYELHGDLLEQLEAAVDGRSAALSCVGDAFLRHENSFEIYAAYCNNRPTSCAELSCLLRQPAYYQFFEACRLLRGMPKLPLDGFLLTPVQRICQYPLQLAELVKATRADHPDALPAARALQAMRRVATVVNDSKRRLETAQKIAAWQRSVEGWQGADLLDSCQALVQTGELACRCVLNGCVKWTKDLVLFLFDQTLVLCKKDKIRKNHLLFRDRVELRSARYTYLSDGKDVETGFSVKHAWKLTVPERNVHFVFLCRSRKLKTLWDEAFQRLKQPAVTQL